MNPQKGLRVLLVDDNPDDRALVVRDLEREFPRVEVEEAIDMAGLRRSLEGGGFDLVITDYQLRWTNGIDVLRAAKARWPHCPVIMFTATGTEEVAVEAMKSGLDDYVIKSPKHFARLAAAVHSVLRAAEERRGRRRAESRYEDLYRNAPVAYLTIGGDGHIVDVNKAACAFFARPREELHGMEFLDLYADESRDEARRLYERCRDGVAVDNVEMVFNGEAGARVYGLLSINPLKDEAGCLIATRAVVVDISGRKRAEGRLERLNRLFLGLGADPIANMGSIMETGKELLGAAMAHYDRMERGSPLQTLSTAPGETLMSIEEPGDHVCIEVMRSRGPLALEDLEATPYAERDPLVMRHGLKSFLGYPVILEGRLVGCLSFFDTRRRIFARDEIALAGTLARALAIEEERMAREEHMKDFIDVASHELRHPITLMKGYALSLRELWERLDAERVWEMLEAIDSGAERLERLVTGLLELSRIERGRFSIKRREAELATLVARAVDGLMRGGARNEFRVNIPVPLGAVSLDPERIEELVMILLENAVKFSPPGAPVDIEVNRIDGEILLSVLDRGAGIPDDYRELVFQRFLQVEDALHHSVPGIGMGLYIAREIVEAHGGRIWCEPREGGGSAFRLTLPA